MNLPRRPRTKKPAFDASDPKAIKLAEQESQVREVKRREVAATILGSLYGREWLWQILSDTGIWEKRISMTGEHENGFYEGQREVGLNLLRFLCAVDPANAALMISENDQRA